MMQNPPLVQEYEGVASGLAGAAHASVAALRSSAVAAYREQGLPHSKVEAWKYTRLKDLETLPFVRSDAAVPPTGPIIGAGVEGLTARVVLVDGQFAPALSDLPRVQNLSVLSLRASLDAGDSATIAMLDRNARFSDTPLAALASAYLDDGAVLRVGVGAKVAVEVIYQTSAAETPRMVFPRLAVSVADGAELVLIETYVGSAQGVYASNAVTDIDMGVGATLKHYVLQAQGADATHVSIARCDLPADARYEGFVLQVGGKVSRHEMQLRLVGLGADAHLNGAYAVDGVGTCDTTTVVEHISADTTSDQVFKGLLDGRSRGIYQGKVHVHQDAQRIVGNQLHNGLLLSRAAEVDCKPELEIYADDVKCSHGATVGELAAEQVFYLRSRGIDDMMARHMLMQAFLADALNLITEDAVRAAFERQILTWLQARGGHTE